VEQILTRGATCLAPAEQDDETGRQAISALRSYLSGTFTLPLPSEAFHSIVTVPEAVLDAPFFTWIVQLSPGTRTVFVSTQSPGVFDFCDFDPGTVYPEVLQTYIDFIAFRIRDGECFLFFRMRFEFGHTG